MVTITAGEWSRKAIHAGFGLFALSFRWLDWKSAAAVAFAALLFNLFVLPRFGRGIYRDAKRSRDPGIVAYAAMVLALVLLLRDHYLTVAAAVWAMMAFGDPAAAIAGELLDGPTLPWNRTKRWIGLVANWAAGATASVLVFWFVSARPLELSAAVLLVAGAAVYAFLESVRAGIDDNLVAAVPTALFLVQLGRWPEAPLAPFHAGSWGRLGVALAVNFAAALVSGGTGLVSRSGALAGAVAGFLVMAYGGWPAYALLWAFFLAATAATKWGYREKRDAGVAQADSGRRGAANVAANCLVPIAFLVLGLPAAAFAGALGAALADTLGTEVGTLFGRHPRSPLTFETLAPGMPGAVSRAGTAAAFAGAVAIALAAWVAGWLPRGLVIAVLAGGFLGALSESVLTDLGRRLGFRLDHEFANAFNTFAGGLIALEIALSVEMGSVWWPVQPG
ncbi:MAG: hypothetical protein DMF54_13590 [Acidobacteria bacterium]|nr:MAG: hypothetical protein DMF55_06860 [Acidobacteriota bacterium]PYQ64664.1 MAG: hypothetical protein DMF54_13590 [Acidobacteriota bacterium]